jgi:hypothetical protein
MFSAVHRLPVKITRSFAKTTFAAFRRAHPQGSPALVPSAIPVTPLVAAATSIATVPS